MRHKHSPPLSDDHDPRRPNSSHSPTEVPHVHSSSVSCRSRSHTRVKGKGKRRASARTPSPPEFDISCRFPVVRHERTGVPEVLVTPDLSHFENTPEGNAAVSCTPTGDAPNPLLLQTPENDSGGTPVVSPPLPDENPSMTCATHTTNGRHSPSKGPRSLNEEIIASSSSKSETPKLTINTNRGRANPMRGPRYGSQRDTIIAHLRGSVATPRRSLQSRMTGQTVAELNVSGDGDTDVARRTVGSEGHVHFASSLRTVERSSGLSDSDDPPGGSKKEDPEERTVTKAGVHLIQSTQGMMEIICLATWALITSILIYVFFFSHFFQFYLLQKGRFCCLDHPPRHLVLHLPTRIYLTGYMTMMTRRRLPLRRRAYAHRYGSARALLPNAGSHRTTLTTLTTTTVGVPVVSSLSYSKNSKL